MSDMATKQQILNLIEDVVTKFVYYDRKESDIGIEDLNEAVRSGEISIEEMVEKFRDGLEATFKDA